MAYGGAIFSRNGSLSATFCTFSGNTAANGGTDIFVLDDDTTTANATLALNDSILGQQNNSVSNLEAGGYDTLEMPAISGSSNLIRKTSLYDFALIEGETFSTVYPSFGIISNANPLLGPLQDNGGPTQTMAPLAGSPALDAGGTDTDGLTTDQRGEGFDRLAGSAADVGAVENNDSTLPVLFPVSLPDPSANASYAASLYIVGPGAPYSFAVTSGNLPSGLTLTSTGDTGGNAELSGTPTVPGAYTFTVTATDQEGDSASASFTLTVGPAILLSPTVLPVEETGTFYSQTISASGSSPPYSFAVTAGDLPAGLTLSASGVLSGTSTEAGTFGFVITATAADGSIGTAGYTLQTIPFDPATSTVSVSSPSVSSGGSVTVTLQAEDADGSDLTTGGQSVTFVLGSTGGGQGMFSAVTDNGNGTYTATFTGTLAGGNTITAVVDGQTLSSGSPSIVVTPGPVSLGTSAVGVATESVAAGSGDAVTLQTEDAAGNDLTTGGLTVTFVLGSTSGGQGTFSAVTDNGNGTYTATFTGAVAGSNTIIAEIDGTAVASTADITVGSLDPANALVELSSGSLAAGDSVTITVQTRDAAGNDLTSGGAAVALSLGGGNGWGDFGAVTDNGNGTYTVTFTGKIAGSNTITATIDGQAVTATPPTVSVAPGAADPANSLIFLTAPEIQLDGTDSITLQARDAYGNDVDANNFNVAFSLEYESGGRGAIDKVKNNENGTYTADFRSTGDGGNIINASVDGVAIGSTAPIAVAGGAFSLSESTVEVESSTILAGASTTVTLQMYYPKNDPEPAGGLSVTFELGSAGGGRGTFSPVTDNHDGTYAATFTGSLSGANTIEAFVDGKRIASVAAFSVTKGPLSLAHSPVTISSASVAAGNEVTATLQPEDAGGNKLNLSGLKIIFTLGGGNGQGTFGAVTENKNGAYTATFSGTIVGDNTVLATIDGQAVTSGPPSIRVVPGQVSLSHSVVSVTQGPLEAGGSATVVLQVRDAFGNAVTAARTVAFELASATGAKGVFGPATNDKNGSYTATFTGTIAGTNSIAATVGGHKATSTAPAVTVTPGAVSLAKSLVTISSPNVKEGSGVTVTLQAKDAYGNKETVGGLIVVFALANTKGGQGTFGSVTDNDNGTYTVTFAGAALGSNTIEALISDTKVASTTAIKVVPSA